MTIQPLNDRVPIINPDGTPSQFFIRMLQERGITVGEKITEDEAIALIDAWAAARDINVTAPITGGGPLSADVTIGHATSGVTPGTYGDATNSPQITVDDEGHITAIADVPISGGGGGGGSFASVTFQAPGGVLTVLKSNNIASVTRTGTGIYRILFTTPASDDFYHISALAQAELFGGDYAIGVAINRNNTGSSKWDTAGFDLIVGDGTSIFDAGKCSVMCFEIP